MASIESSTLQERLSAFHANVMGIVTRVIKKLASAVYVYICMHKLYSLLLYCFWNDVSMLFEEAAYIYFYSRT